MFSNLDEQIQQTQGRNVSPASRLLRLLSVLGLTTVLFGSLYLSIMLFE